MRLTRIANLMEKGLAPLTNAVGAIGAGIIGLMMLVTVVDVGGRRVFNSPLIGSMDLTILMMVIVVFFSIAHCELIRGHVSIDLVVSRLSQKSQDIINSIMYFFFLALFSWTSWQTLRYALQVWHNHIESATLEIPVYPFVFAAALGLILLSLLVLSHLLSFLAGALKK